MKNQMPHKYFYVAPFERNSVMDLNITGQYMNKYNSSSVNIILQFKTKHTEVSFQGLLKSFYILTAYFSISVLV